MNHETCPLCNGGYLAPKTEVVSISYKGVEEKLKSQFSTCSACQSDITDAQQLAFNKAQTLDFRKRVDATGL